MHCVNCAALVPVPGMQLQIYCANRPRRARAPRCPGACSCFGRAYGASKRIANRDVPVRVPGMGLQMHCVHRAVLAPVLCVQLRMLCVEFRYRNACLLCRLLIRLMDQARQE